MINEQLLTKEAFLKLAKEQAWDYYEQLARRYSNVRNNKAVLRDQIENKEEILRNIKSSIQLQLLRDRKNGSLRHEKTHALKEEAISIWWEIKRVNKTKQVSCKQLGNMHEEETQLPRARPVSTLNDEAPREDSSWPLSKTTYQRINKAAKKAWQHPEIINDSWTFLNKTLEYYRA
jgi:hypothetical protein